MSSPLAGIRVLEFSQAIAGPTCGRYLAEHGAEVIRVENARRLDNLRQSGSSWLPAGTPQEVSRDTRPSLSTFNAGKLSVGIDPSMPEGKDLVLKLAAKSDVLVANLSVNALPSMGLGYKEVRAVRPDIIYCSLPAFGNTDGPYRDFKAWGPNLAGLAGIDHLTGWPDRPPAGIGNVAYVDFMGGFEAAIEILAAILERDLTGRGAFIDIAQYEAAVACLGPAVMDLTANGNSWQRQGNRCEWAAPHGVFPSRGDDRWIAITAFSDKHWAALCLVAEGEGFASDPRFATMSSRLELVDELEALIGGWTRSFTGRELEQRLQEAGCPASQVSDLADLVVDDQLESRQFYRLGHHARFGQDLFGGYPPRLSDAHWGVDRANPCLGEDDDAVLGGILGIGLEEQRRLLELGAIFTMPPAPLLRRPYTRWARHFLRLEGWPS
jgi:benzylsuccinate CoA-transferase BbsF subunit